MAFFLQYRGICQRVQQQLAELNDQEKVVSDTPSPRLSGDTIPVDGEAPNEDLRCKREDVYAAMDGISVETDCNGELYYLVKFESDNDTANPRNWSLKYRIAIIFLLIAIAFVAIASSSVDSAVTPQAAEDLGVSEVVETLGGTAMFLIGLGWGALICSPASEMVGRYPVYIVSMAVFGCWLVGAALSPNIGAQIVFRFLAGFFSSPALTVIGGSISDLFTAKEKTWAFPLFAIVGFGGPLMGPVIASYVSVTGVLNWRWAEWLMLIADGLVLALVLAFMKETLPPQILSYKARHLRKLTGNPRFKAAHEASGETFIHVAKRHFTRPFILCREPIVFVFTLYLSVIYVVLFTFLDGYPYIFQRTYGINQGLSNLCFLGLFVGVTMALALVPIVYRITKKQLLRDGDDGTGKVLNQETRLIFSMIGAPLIPIGLLWMAWTDYPSISIWSPIVASGFIGLGLVCVFMSAYMYVIQTYEIYSASALTFVALVRYNVAGGMTVAGLPLYSNVGTHWTLTFLACLSALLVPVPYVLYIWGSRLRARSKYAVSQ